MAYKSINPEIWSDCHFEETNPQEKLIWFYLMTCELRGVSGIFKVTVKRISDNTGIEREAVRAALEQGKVTNVDYDFTHGVVFLKNGYKYRPRGGNWKIIRASVLADYRKTQACAGHWQKFCTIYEDFDGDFFTLKQPLVEGSAGVESSPEEGGVAKGSATVAQPLAKGSPTVGQGLNNNNPNPKDKDKDKNKKTARACVPTPANGSDPSAPAIDFLDLEENEPRGNGHKSPEEMRVDHLKAEANRFLDHARAAHLKIRGGPLVLAKRAKALVPVIHWVSIDGLSAEVLGVCWDFFLRDRDPWLVGRARNLAIFGSRLNDYLEKTRASEQAEARKIQERGPVPKVVPDPEAEALWEKCLKYLAGPEADILPDNFETWLALTVGLVVTRERVVIGVPTAFHAKCLAENFQQEIKAALAQVKIKPAPKLEFLHEYEVVDA